MSPDLADATRDALALLRAEAVGDFDAVDVVLDHLAYPRVTCAVLAGWYCAQSHAAGADVLTELDNWQEEHPEVMQ